MDCKREDANNYFIVNNQELFAWNNHSMSLWLTQKQTVSDLNKDIEPKTRWHIQKKGISINV